MSFAHLPETPRGVWVGNTSQKIHDPWKRQHTQAQYCQLAPFVWRFPTTAANALWHLNPPPPPAQPTPLEDTRGEPRVLTSFSLDLGSPVIGKCTFFMPSLYNTGAEPGFGGDFTRGSRPLRTNAPISGHPGGLTPGNPRAFAPRHLQISPTHGQYSSTKGYHCPSPG